MVVPPLKFLCVGAGAQPALSTKPAFHPTMKLTLEHTVGTGETPPSAVHPQTTQPLAAFRSLSITVSARRACPLQVTGETEGKGVAETTFH